MVRLIRLHSLVLAGMLCALCVSTVMAQTPSSIAPGQVIQKFKTPGLPQATQRPAPAPRQDDFRPSDAVHFVLSQIVVEGTTVYTPDDFAGLSKPYVGQSVTFSDLQSLARALTAKYRNDGYLISQVILPEQKIKNGVVRFVAREGYVSKVFFEGDETGDHIFLSNAAAKILALNPLTAKGLERYLLLMDDLPGVTIRSVFRPSPDTQNASELMIQIKKKRVEASISVDNRGTAFLGPVQWTGVASVNGLLRPFDRTTLRAITTSSTHELRFADMLYEHQIGTEGAKLFLRGAVTQTEPGGSLASLNIEGESTLLSAEIAHPFIRSREKNVKIYGGIQYLDTETDLAGIPSGEDRLRTIQLGTTLDFIDPWWGVNLFDLSVRQGLSILNATKDGAGRTRTNGNHDFTALNVYATRVQGFPGQLSAQISAAGQVASDALLAAEEFAVGGDLFGRAYDTAEITGEHGAAFAGELRYSDTVPYDFLTSYQAYMYYDIGAVWNTNRVVLENARDSLAAAGVGVRLNFPHDISGHIELAVPLTRSVQSKNSDGDKARVFFKLGKRF